MWRKDTLGQIIRVCIKARLKNVLVRVKTFYRNVHISLKVSCWSQTCFSWLKKIFLHSNWSCDQDLITQKVKIIDFQTMCFSKDYGWTYGSLSKCSKLSLSLFLELIKIKKNLEPVLSTYSFWPIPMIQNESFVYAQNF